MDTQAELFTLAPGLAAIVRPGVIWWSGATVVAHEHRLDPLLAEAEARVRITPPAGVGRGADHVQAGRHRSRPRRGRPTRRCCAACARATPFRGSTRSSTSSTGARSSSSCRTASTTSSKISGPVTMRLGAEGESYAGIRKDDVNVGGRITVADSVGAFGNPTSDSARTMVTPATTEALVIVYAPAEVLRSRSRACSTSPRSASRRSPAATKRAGCCPDRPRIRNQRSAYKSFCRAEP